MVLNRTAAGGVALVAQSAGAFGARHRALLVVTVAVGVAAVYGLARLFDVPREPGFGGSLLAGPSPAVAVLVTAAAVLAVAVAGAVIAGSAHFDAGVFAAAVGLGALSVRCGPVGPVLRAGGAGAYRVMLLELVLLAALLLVAWWLARQITRGWLARDDSIGDLAPGPPAPLGRQVLALLVQAGATAVLMLLLAQSPAKKQVLIALGGGAFFASLLAHHLVPVRGSAWFWGGVLLVGVVGYGYAMIRPGPAALGAPANPLVAAVPLDYASLGVAGATFGYWASRRWQVERVGDEGVKG